MSDTIVLEAQARDRVGKGASRELRRNKMVPAVIYGDKKEPLSIALPFKELSRQTSSRSFMTSLVDITLDGKKHSVLPKDIQFDAVRDFVIHVDFLRVSGKTVVTVEIPVHFLNEEECPGLKAGGVLNIVRHAVEVNCPASAIPEHFEVDLINFELGDSVNISSVTLPDGVEPTITDRDFTIATIASPAGLKSEDDDTAAPEAPETEVIGAKPEDDATEE
ncbi:MAG: 50S ribosomal protein L25/general stress protein Ctc [Hyphomicrobiales bacterium]|nr:MAG: 50S ribosomal protein L25/general stress protein Ctc [Hyphomicrobiales bacterium]